MSSGKRRPFCLGFNVLNTAHIQVVNRSHGIYYVWITTVRSTPGVFPYTDTPSIITVTPMLCMTLIDSELQRNSNGYDVMRSEVVWFLNVIKSCFQFMSWQQKWWYRCDYFPRPCNITDVTCDKDPYVHDIESKLCHRREWYDISYKRNLTWDSTVLVEICSACNCL